jgi:hypothetical protein
MLKTQNTKHKKTNNAKQKGKQKMKTLLISTKAACMILAITGFALSSRASPIPITGSISFAGSTTINGTSFVTATAFSSFQNVTVGAPSALSGSYVGTSGATVTMTPFIWSPPTASTPVNPLWTFVSGGDTYSFDLSVLHVDYASTTGLLLSGLGTAYITGSGLDFLATTGTWNLSSQTLGQSSFTFSSTTTVPNSVPDGGTTATLLGGSLLGLAYVGRKQKLNHLKSL